MNGLELVVGVIAIVASIFSGIGGYRKLSGKLILIKEWIDVIATFLQSISPDSPGGRKLTDNERKDLLKQLDEARNKKW